jgi:P-type E1-E2 ATPase
MDLYYNNFMIEVNIPGRGIFQLEHLVCDVNGTLAEDGKLHAGLARTLLTLKDRLQIHLVTADTLGCQDEIDKALNLTAFRTQSDSSGEQKVEFVRQLGAEHVVAVGQGENDAGMLKEAALGIGILSREGISTSAISSADLVVPDIFSALELLDKPMRIVSTLRK